MEDHEMNQKYIEEIIKPFMKSRNCSFREAVKKTYYKSFCQRCEDFFDMNHECFGGEK